MSNLQESLKKFKYLSSQLCNALEKNDYQTVVVITERQEKIIRDFSDVGIAATEETNGRWNSALEEFQVLRKHLQNDLKKLNNNTRNNLRRLKGYSLK